MPKIEILAYTPTNLDDFIKFCIKGKGSRGVPDKDEDNRAILGVMSWLHGRGVKNVQFFHTPRNHPMNFFMSLVQKHEDEPEDRPWFKTIKTSPPKLILEPDIAGIDKMLRVDGELGELDAFVPISELLGAVERDTSLEAEFAAQRVRVENVLKQLEKDVAAKRRFLAALRSDRGSEPTEVFTELEFSLFD